MSTLQVRDVPDELRRVMKERAARAGMSLSDYLRSELERLAAQPTFEEWAERVRSRATARPETSAADILRGEREGR